METLVSKELLHTTLDNNKNQWTGQVKKLKSELETSKGREQELLSKINSLAAEGTVYKSSLEKLENEMSDKWTSEVRTLRSELETKMENEQVLMNEIDSLAAKLTDNNYFENLVKETLLRFDSSCSNPMYLYPHKSGVYVVKNGMQVYCDQTTDGGGWTVFQRRKDGSVDFERNWADYKAGFGDLEGEFCLGNDNIHDLTATGNHELRVDMVDFEGNKAYAKYSNFSIKSESDNYTIEVSGYSGDAGDSLRYHNGIPFSTKDKDNDKWPRGNCSKSYSGAWWYGYCHHSNLNGFYYYGANSPSSEGIVWSHWKETVTYSLKYVEMKFR